MSLNDQQIALQFPGQGAQKVGMGKDLYREESLARKTFDRANDVLGYDLANICFEGPSEDLTETRHSQPAILVTSIAFYRVLQEKRTHPVEPIAGAGLSLGEYSALVAAGALRFRDALELVRVRAEAMQEDCDREPSGMVSILGMNFEDVQKLVEDAREEGIASVANYNSPGQIVVSGNNPALEFMRKEAENRGARRVISLKVAGAFHSPLMEPAAKKVQNELQSVDFREPEFPVITNTTGDVLSGTDEIRESLGNQVTSPVLWEPTIRTFLDLGAETFLEVGPGRVLSGLVKKVKRDRETVNVQNYEDLLALIG